MGKNSHLLESISDDINYDITKGHMYLCYLYAGYWYRNVVETVKIDNKVYIIMVKIHQRA